MKRANSIVLLLAAATASLLPASVAEAAAAEKPKDRVVVMYFHRTQRCPTCQKMGAYSQEAVEQGFDKEAENGVVEFHYIDFQNEKNARLTKGYKITGPALVVAEVRDNKVAEYKNLKDIWAKVGDKRGFVTYVRENVAKHLK